MAKDSCQRESFNCYIMLLGKFFYGKLNRDVIVD